MRKLLPAATGEGDRSDPHAEHRVGRWFRNIRAGAHYEQTRRVVRHWGVGSIDDRSSQYGIRGEVAG